MRFALVCGCILAQKKVCEMDYENLLRKRDYLQQNISSIPEPVLKNYEDTFAVEYAHNSTAIENRGM